MKLHPINVLTNNLKQFVVSVALLVFAINGFAQTTAFYNALSSKYNTALDLYEKEQFGVAIRAFDEVIGAAANNDSELSVLSSYYKALCAMRLVHKDAEFLMKQFVEDHPESPKVQSAYYELALYNYQKRKWDDVIAYGKLINEAYLTNEQISEYLFKLGYSYFMEDELDRAIALFLSVKEVPSQYAYPAQYYYAHISYTKKNYQTALVEFKKLESVPQFASIVPYYLAQIYFQQKKYDELLAYAQPLVDKADEDQAVQLARLLGEAHYGRGEFKEAIPFFELFGTKTRRQLSTDEQYKLGFCYYYAGDYSKAVDQFAPLTMQKDSLSQICLYHLADCYLQQDKKSYARNAFLAASELTFDDQITEDALFNYAKLSYELSYNPYNKSIDAFKDYIEKYPKSPNVNEAYDYLVNVYLTTKNYRAAITSIEQAKKIDYRLQGAYQRVCFNRAVELYNNSDYKGAVTHFKKAQRFAPDRLLNTLGFYWQAESYYQMQHYDSAIVYYQNFKYGQNAVLTSEFNFADYNIGYSYFKQKDYDKAITAFRKFVGNRTETDLLKKNDALLRIGDAYFIQKKYDYAADFYEQAHKIDQKDSDYALYQAAMAYGVLRDSKSKVNALETLVSNYENSMYGDAALYELGKTYFQNDKNKLAEEYFLSVIKKYPKSDYVRRSLINIGLIQYNNNENEAALITYKRVIKDYPSYELSKEALNGLRDAYISLNRIDEYQAYLEGLGFIDVNQTAIDSAAYQAAERMYFDGKCEKAITGFANYLTKYNPALFAENAHYYKALCLMNAGREAEALEDYNAIIALPNSKFTEVALVEAALINVKNKNTGAALKNYLMLEEVAQRPANRKMAKVGLMRSFNEVKNYSSAIEYANKVLAFQPEQGVEVEAIAIIARSAYELGQTDIALEHFQKVLTLTQSELRAEAQYYIANMVYQTRNLDSAEALVFEMVNSTPSYDFWIAKGLVLLSQIYLDRGDTFQAKATLDVVNQNTSNQEILQEVTELLNQIRMLETPADTLQTQDSLPDIDFTIPVQSTDSTNTNNSNNNE